MKLDDLVTRIINHIDETAIKTENKLKQEIHLTKTDIMCEVNVLLEQQRDTLIKFPDTRATAIEDRLTSIENRLTATEDGLGQLNNRIDKIDTRMIKMENRIEKMDSKIDSLVEDMDIVKPMITHINDRLTKTETTLKQVK